MNIEGRNPVLESLRANPENVMEIFIRDRVHKDDKMYEIVKLAKKHKIKMRFVKLDFLERVSDTGKHQGVIAVRSALPVLSFRKIVEEGDDNMMLIYIRESFNEYNIGSIIRTAECTGASAVVLSPKTKITPQVIRASMGASENVSIVHEGLFTAIKECKDAGVKVVGIEVTGVRFYYESDLTGKIMFIIGGEDRSLSDAIMNKCDEVVKIPLEGQINSLNMGVATGVVMYEKLRQDATI
jgi:23S rRNA (guanosine2251-2'-O)-methyltransferase